MSPSGSRIQTGGEITGSQALRRRASRSNAAGSNTDADPVVYCQNWGRRHARYSRCVAKNALLYQIGVSSVLLEPVKRT